jgi:hypothetical protein
MVRWYVIQINIVGSIVNNEEIKQIETVSKSFVIAERMIKITDTYEKIDKDKSNESAKKAKINNKINVLEKIHNLNVRGLN